MLPEPPYYAVIFTTLLRNQIGYHQAAVEMTELARCQPGYLGIESVHDEAGRGITVSYWRDQASIRNWKNNTEHRQAQTQGRSQWYAGYSVRVAKVERAYDFGSGTEPGFTTL